MSKNLIKLLIFLLTPLLIVVGFSSWVIVGEKSQIVGESTAVAVCYNSVTGTQYTRIEKALEDAISGQTIYVYPGLKESDNTTSLEIRIHKDCTIKAGVILCLPYSGQEYYSRTTWGSLATFSDIDTPSVNKYRQTYVVISEGVTLTINSGGKLFIGGIFGRQSAGPTGMVNGNYSELALEKNAKIISYGTIDCYGMLKEADFLNNNSMVEIVRGNVNIPFVIYDYKGGSDSLELHNKSPKVCPFDVYDVGNVQTLFRIHSGTSVKAEYRLYMNSTQLPGIVNFIGSTNSNTMLVLSSGYIDIKYTPSSFGHTKSEVVEGQTKINLFGTMSIGSIQLNVKMIVSVTLNTADYHLPFPYKFHFSIEDGSSMTINNKTKFLQGSVVHIQKGGNLYVQSEVIFFEKYDISTLTSLGVSQTYPVNLSSASLINDGYLNIASGASLGVEVKSETKNAVLDVGTTDYSVSLNLNGENYTDTKAVSLSGVLTGASTATTLSNKVYVSQSDYKWKEYTGSFTLNYYKVYTDREKNIISCNQFTDHSESTSTIAANGSRLLGEYEQQDNIYNFVGWYFDEECNERIISNTVYGSQLINLDTDENGIVNVYARFTSAPIIDITYYGVVSSSSIDTTAIYATDESLAGESFVLKSALNEYYVEENNVRKYYGFTNWIVSYEYNDGTMMEVIVDAGSVYNIPQDFDGDAITVTAADYEYLYSKYKLTLSKSLSTLYGASATVTNGSEELATGTNWVEKGAIISVSITGGELNYIFGTSKHKTTATISGVTTFISGSSPLEASGKSDKKTAIFEMPESTVSISING